MPDKLVTPVDSIYQIMGFHVDLSTIDQGEPVQCPDGWMPLGMARQEGNDATILLYRQIQ